MRVYAEVRYPLRLARLQSLHTEKRRYQRLSIRLGDAARRYYKDWHVKAGAKYATVKLVRVKKGWGLHYDGNDWCTGPFQSMREAIAWYQRGGR